MLKMFKIKKKYLQTFRRIYSCMDILWGMLCCSQTILSCDLSDRHGSTWNTLN